MELTLRWMQGDVVVAERRVKLSAKDPIDPWRQRRELNDAIKRGPFEPCYHIKEGKAVELAPLVIGVPNEFQDGDAISLWDSKVTSATKEIYTLQNVALVAALIANVAFVGYVTPPGGDNPYWESCTYPFFIAFVILNGLAFIFSVVAVLAVTFAAFLSKHSARSWQRDVRNVSSCLLFFALLAFSSAFFLSGLVSAGYKTPDAACGLLKCGQGGVNCQPFRKEDAAFVDLKQTYFLDPDVAVLNGFPNAISAGVDCLFYPRIRKDPDSSKPSGFKYQVVGTVEADVAALEFNDTVKQMVICAPKGGNRYKNLEVSDMTAFELTNGTSIDDEVPILQPHLLPSQVWNDGYKTLSNFTYVCKSTQKKYSLLCDVNSGLAVAKDGKFVTKEVITQSGGIYLRSDPISSSFSSGVIAMWVIFWAVLVSTVVICACSGHWGQVFSFCIGLFRACR